MARAFFSFIGAYPIVYVENGIEQCGDCASDKARAHVHLEGEPIECSECNYRIESAYGSPEEW